MLGLLYDAIDSVESFLQVFVYVYSLLILAYILTSWVRLPYSVWLNRIQRFLYDGVLGKHRGDTWGIVSPSFRQGFTHAQWEHGVTPIALLVLDGPIRVVSCAGSAGWYFAAAATAASTASSCRSAGTSRRVSALHAWPLFMKQFATVILTARTTSAST